MHPVPLIESTKFVTLHPRGYPTLSAFGTQSMSSLGSEIQGAKHDPRYPAVLHEFASITPVKSQATSRETSQRGEGTPAINSKARDFVPCRQRRSHSFDQFVPVFCRLHVRSYSMHRQPQGLPFLRRAPKSVACTRGARSGGLLYPTGNHLRWVDPWRKICSRLTLVLRHSPLRAKQWRIAWALQRTDLSAIPATRRRGYGHYSL